MGMPRRVAVTYRDSKKVEPYEQALRIAGIEWVLIHPESGRRIDALDGLLLTGGTDVNPKLYQQARHSETEEPDDARDAMEKRLLECALERDLPVLAICRGMQLLNVVQGGTLHQHVEGHRQPGVARAHAIEVESDSILARVIGAGISLVNSRHHQVIDKFGKGLRVSAKSPDGHAEALERNDRRFVVAVQWHPEDLVASDAGARKLFGAFAESL